MSGPLGLNEHHHDTIVNYLRFNRYKRGQNLRGVEGCFQDLRESRLTEDTFTADEVADILDGLEAVVRGEVESELINTAHTNVVLLRKLFQQAEKWHLKLQADTSEMENRELIEMIAEFEESEFSGKAPTKPTFEMKRLDPLEGGDVQLLQKEIERLNEENDKLKERLKAVELQATDALSQKSKLQSDLNKARDSMGNVTIESHSDDTSHLELALSSAKSEMEKNLKMSSDKSSALENDLVRTKHELLAVQEQLELKGKELEQKFSQTATYKNLKSMLVKKNEQIKELRGKMRKYEDEDDGDED